MGETCKLKFLPMVSLLLLLCCFSSLWTGCDAKKIPKWWMRVAQRQGPNACVVEQVPGTGKEFWTECKYWLNRKICGRKTIARFECCEGFEQIEGENGCTRVKPLLNLLDTAEALGATRWAAYIRESGLANELETAGAYTLFAPTNEAFDTVKDSLRSQLESYRGNPNNPVLLYHILPTKLESDHFEANTVIETRHQGHFLRINKYSNGMNTVNCALFLQKDQQATNGIVHIIDNVLDPSKSLSDNVADVVLKDGRFSVLSEMLEKSGYMNVLRTMQGSITFLAPSDEAFQKLPDSRREKIINDREARLALLQNHIIPHVICESAITGEHRVGTVSNNKLTFNCDITGAYVETSKLRNNFNLGKNGIIHILDDVLLPDRAKNLVELAESRQLFTFVELVRNAGLEETLSHTGDYTFFVPDENAWFELSPAILQRARNDVEYAGLLLRFHGAYGRHLTNSITDNQAIMSLDEENPLRLQVWRRALGVEDAKITNPDIEAQNGVIHIINRVIFPSNETVSNTLQALPGGDTFDNYLELLQQATAQTPSLLNLGPGDDSFYTFFVPTDDAFRRMDSNQRAALQNGGSDVTKAFVKKHVAVNMFPYTSFEPNLIYSIEGMDGQSVQLKKDAEGKLSANGAAVKSSHMSANGVVHVIDEVFEMSSTTTFSGGTGYHGSGGDYGSSEYGGGGSVRTHHSSSSSSSSTGGTTRTTKTYRKTVTFSEGFDDFDGIPVLPQGTELTGREPEVVPSPNFSSADSYEERGDRTPSGRPDPLMSSLPGHSDASVLENDFNNKNEARLHGHVRTHSRSSSHSSVSRRRYSNPNVYSYPRINNNVDSERRKQGGLIRSNERRWKVTDNESETSDNTGNSNEIEVDEETRRKLVLAELEEVRRQEEIRKEEEKRKEEARKQEEIRRQEELRREEEKLRLEELRIEEERLRLEEIRLQEEIRRREELEREEEIVRVRQNELRELQEENRRLEAENRQRELEEENRKLEIEERRIQEKIQFEKENKLYQGRTSQIGDSYDRPPFHWAPSPPLSYVNVETSAGEANPNYEPGLLSHSSSSSKNELHRNINPIQSNSTVSTSRFITHSVSHNTIGPVTPNGTRFSYVGRSYGNDIVGHESNKFPNPLLRSGNSGTYNFTSSKNSVIGTGILNRGVTTKTRKKVNLSRTIYSYPNPVGGERALSSNALAPSDLSKIRKTFFSNSFNENRRKSMQHKPGSDFLSAYAFTGGETEYADGQEFVESGSPVMATITVNQARALRRQWRRKRHQMAALNGGKRLRMRKGRGKRMRKGLRKRQALRRMKKMEKQSTASE